jgi:predicted dehydrogenase
MSIPATAERKLRLIHAGVGGMGDAWIKAATSTSPDFQTVAIVDISPDALAKAGEALGVPPAMRFADLPTAIKAAPADAVLSVTPPPVHALHARIAFDHGLHFITEKPITADLSAAKEMVRHAQIVVRQLVVAQNYRYSASALALKSVVQVAPLGDLGHGHLDFYIPGDFASTFRGTMQYPLLVDMAIHHFDLIRAITGRNILAVTAHSFRPAWSWYQHDPGLKVLFELEGGLSFSYSGDWSAYGKSTSWNGSWRLQCAQGSVRWEQDKIYLDRSGFWGKDQTTEEVQIPPAPLSGQAALLKNFATAIRTGRPAETSGADNLYSFAVVMACVQSIEEKRTVRIAELLA